MSKQDEFAFFHGAYLENILKEKYRVYLCGDLATPQETLECIYDDKLEVGTSYYSEFTADAPHYHTHATEYNFVVSGRVKLFLFDKNESYEFEQGSLYVLPPNTRYATKNAPGTQVLFIKCPGGMDKVLYEADGPLQGWLGSWDGQ